MMSAMRPCLVAECLFSLPCAWNGSADYRTAQHSTAQHSTAQHSTAQHSTAQRSHAVFILSP
ncbi:hypothetical protein LY76DRAFT_586186 [Colletotrichum caudatum]|nr:hypothetical protein LY76DRAFT_586186 [Colletotrichum caudatum]